ncbi:leucine-rich repeat domain-containing protein [Neorhodopirellula pilleata]|nr:hypothetical protein [Neorhodopirellula pilleata]
MNSRGILVVVFWILWLNPRMVDAVDRTKCILPQAVSQVILADRGDQDWKQKIVEKSLPNRPITRAGVLPTDALGIGDRSTGGDLDWHRYMAVWQADHNDLAVRRWLGLPVQDEVQVATRRGRVSPRFLPWMPGSFVVLQTPHFEILSRADAESSQRIARDVERLYWVWTQMYFPMWAGRDQVAVVMDDWDPSQLSVAEHLSRQANQRLSSQTRHRIVLLPDAKTYQLTVSNPQIAAGASANVAASEGFYSDTLATSFFYPQENLSSLAHEIAHQLFEEATDRPRRTRTAGTTKDFWLIEGIAGHFESFHAGFSLASVGGWQSDRLQYVRYQTLIAQQLIAPIEELVGNRAAIQTHGDLSRWYSQSILQTHYAMDTFAASPDQGAPPKSLHRPSLLKRLADIYRVDVSDFPTLQSADPTWTADRIDRFLLVDDAVIESNPAYDDATSLCLAGCDVTDAGWALIPPMPRVRWFDASRTPISSRQTRRILDGADRIEQLSLEATQIDNNVIEIVARQKRLRELDVSWTPIDDTFAAGLAACPSIETVWLTGTKVSDATLSVLAKLPDLKTVDVQRTAVSDSGITTLRQSHPDWEINPLNLAP